MEWFIIVNPLAGGGSAGSRWKAVSSLLKQRGISFRSGFTDSPETTRLLSRKAIDLGFGGIGVFGGDGTVSDAASVLAGNLNVALSILPAGSGNDWARSLGYPSPSAEFSIASMACESFATVDTAVARWKGSSRFFLNSSGTGFDALVLRRAISLREHLPLNRTCYALSLLFSALVPPAWEGEFSCDGSVFYRGEYLTFTTGVGRYSGGGMLLAPSAVPTDGELDGLCLTPLSFLKILSNFRRIFNGTLGETRWARKARGNVFTLRRTGGRPILMELDGEPVNLGKEDMVEFVSVPESIRAAVPIS